MSDPVQSFSGTYGCLVDNTSYKEHRIMTDYQPKITSNVQTPTFGSEVILTCSVRYGFKYRFQ